MATKKSPTNTKATKKSSTKTKAAKASATPKRAKAAFDDYRKRMAAASPMGMMPDGAYTAPHANPFASGAPNAYGMPGWPYPAHPSGMTGPPWAPASTHATMGTGAALSKEVPTGSFFESVATLLRLGVDFANASLAGGMQILYGYAGKGGCDATAHHTMQHGYGHHCCCCQTPHYQGNYGCCCECGHDCCCTPGVHNCP